MLWLKRLLFLHRPLSRRPIQTPASSNFLRHYIWSRYLRNQILSPFSRQPMYRPFLQIVKLSQTMYFLERRCPCIEIHWRLLPGMEYVQYLSPSILQPDRHDNWFHKQLFEWRLLYRRYYSLHDQTHLQRLSLYPTSLPGYQRWLLAVQKFLSTCNGENLPYQQHLNLIRIV